MRYWTVDEARDYLPRLRSLVETVRRAAVPAPGDDAHLLPTGSEHAEAALAEMRERGVILRQLDAGIVDFPSLGADDEVRLLCWRVGEEELAWWHRPQDGFAGRRPLEPGT